MIRRIFSILLVNVITISFIQPVQAQSLKLTNVGTLLQLSEAFDPVILSGMTLDPENPLAFEFFLERGDLSLRGSEATAAILSGGEDRHASLAMTEEEFKQETQKLINYFFTTLTVPDEEMWVNLSPHEPDRIIADGLAQTEMGRDMLAQDYLLKQLSASLMYPEDELGQKFWEKVYASIRRV